MTEAPHPFAERVAEMTRTPSRKTATRYTEIENTLRSEIVDGLRAVGSLLPTEHELCERFAASRFTIRQALAGLRNHGMIEARSGVGTFVIADRPREAFVQTLNSFEELLQYPSETYRKQLEVRTIEATPELAMMLRCSPGQTWVNLKAMRLARGSEAPISWLDAWVQPRFADVLDQPNPKGDPLLKQIETLHRHRAGHAQVEIFVSRISAALSGPLKTDEGAPALTIVRRYRGPDAAVYLVTYSIHPENRFSLNFEFEKQ